VLRHIPLLALTLLASPARASTPDPAAVRLYVKECAVCHGEDGKAETKMGKKHDAESFVDARWQEKHTDEQIEKAIAEGKPKTKMKPWKDKLTAEQIKALVQVVRSFKPTALVPVGVSGGPLGSSSPGATSRNHGTGAAP
jgi:cytochrome c6